MRANLKRRVAALEYAQAGRWTSLEAPLPVMELARRVALLLTRADQGDPAWREPGIRIARILADARPTTTGDQQPCPPDH